MEALPSGVATVIEATEIVQLGIRRAEARIGLKLLLLPGRRAFCGSDDKEVEVLCPHCQIPLTADFAC